MPLSLTAVAISTLEGVGEPPSDTTLQKTKQMIIFQCFIFEDKFFDYNLTREVFLNEAANRESFYCVISVFILLFSSNISVFSFELSPAPTEIVLENKEPEELYYFDPLPTFSSPGTLNEINAIVYKMGDVISGSINESQTNPWYAILRDTMGNNVSVQQISRRKITFS